MTSCQKAVNLKGRYIMEKIEVFWENAEHPSKPGTPCIFAWADLPDGNQIRALFELSDDDFDSAKDCEPSEDADNRAAEFLRAEITKQAKEYGIKLESLDFQF